MRLSTALFALTALVGLASCASRRAPINPTSYEIPIQFVEHLNTKLVTIKGPDFGVCGDTWEGTITIDPQLLGCWLEIPRVTQSEWYGAGKVLLGFPIRASADTAAPCRGTHIKFDCVTKADGCLVGKFYGIAAQGECPPGDTIEGLSGTLAGSISPITSEERLTTQLKLLKAHKWPGRPSPTGKDLWFLTEWRDGNGKRSSSGGLGSG